MQGKPKNDKQFKQNEFIDPPAIYCPAYFWSLNNVLDEKKLMTQLHDMYDHGAKSVCIHPMPPEFRPDTSATQMEPPYLGKKYFELIRKVVEECSRLNMNFYLYDEGAWPSGSAAGRVYARNPQKHALKTVVCEKSWFIPGEKYTVPEEVLCVALDYQNSTCVYLSGETIKNIEHDTKLCTFFVKTEFATQPCMMPLADLLYPDAVKTFLELTHEQFKKHVGEYFGETIKFTFTDEPSLSFISQWFNYEIPEPETSYALSWCDDMPHLFKSKKGYDIIPFIPDFFKLPNDDDSLELKQARIDFRDLMSQLFIERYMLPIRDWCRANNLLSGGHLRSICHQYSNAAQGYAHPLRVMRTFDLPGTDAIWRTIYPVPTRINNKMPLQSPHYPKYPSSVARQQGKQFVLSETFMVYGNGLTPSEMKWITDFQFVLGVNTLVLGHYPYSTNDHFMVFCRPFFGKVNPLWEYMDMYHAYVSRLSYLMSRGKAVCHSAVYYDVRSIWAGGSDARQSSELHNKVADNLLKSQVDFDYIDDDVLISSHLVKGGLVVGEMSYDTVIIPATNWIDKTAMKKLLPFVEAGGHLILVDGIPKADGGQESLAKILEINEPLENNATFNVGGNKVVLATIEHLAENIERTVLILPKTSEIRICKRTCDDMIFYFLCNQKDHPVSVQGTFIEKNKRTLLCDLETGDFQFIESHEVPDGTKIELDFSAWGSMIICFVENASSFTPKSSIKTFKAEKEIILKSDWCIQPVTRYMIGEHDIEIQEIEKPVQHSVELGDWREIIGDLFSGDAEYFTTFDFTEKSECKRIFLDLGQVKYACSVKLNGIDLGRRIWAPFRFEISDIIQSERNQLFVMVTNTLANAIADEKVLKEWQRKNGTEWPNVSFSLFEERQRKFEKDSMPSGLYGPIRLLIEK